MITDAVDVVYETNIPLSAVVPTNGYTDLLVGLYTLTPTLLVVPLLKVYRFFVLGYGLHQHLARNN